MIHDDPQNAFLMTGTNDEIEISWFQDTRVLWRRKKVSGYKLGL